MHACSRGGSAEIFMWGYSDNISQEKRISHSGFQIQHVNIFTEHLSARVWRKLDEMQQKKRGWMLFFFLLSVYPLLRMLVEHWEAKNGDISISDWKHMKSNFTYAVMEQEAASQFFCKTTGGSLRQGKVLLERQSSSISSRTEWKSSSSSLLSSTLKAKKPPLLCYKAKEDSVVCL